MIAETWKNKVSSLISAINEFSKGYIFDTKNFIFVQFYFVYVIL